MSCACFGPMQSLNSCRATDISVLLGTTFNISSQESNQLPFYRQSNALCVFVYVSHNQPATTGYGETFLLSGELTEYPLLSFFLK